MCPFADAAAAAAAATNTASRPIGKDAPVADPASSPDGEKTSLYDRLGGYDDISAFAGYLLKKCIIDEQLGRFWSTMSESTFHNEHINFTDFICHHWGGNTVYRARDMATAHRGMGITSSDWDRLMWVCDNCYDDMDVPQDIREELTVFLTKYKSVIVDVGPSWRQAVCANPEMDVRKNMSAYGINKKSVLPPAPDLKY